MIRQHAEVFGGRFDGHHTRLLRRGGAMVPWIILGHDADVGVVRSFGAVEHLPDAELPAGAERLYFLGWRPTRTGRVALYGPLGLMGAGKAFL